MSKKHYAEQKMLIENFRKWQAEELNEEQELDEVFGLGGEFGDGWVVWDLMQLIAVPTAVLYTLAPYLKIAVHHPSVQGVLMRQDTESGQMFRAMAIGLKGADNAGQWLQDFADKIYGRANSEGKKPGMISRMRNAVALFAFLIVLATTAFPIVGSMVARSLPAATKFIQKSLGFVKKKSNQLTSTMKGTPTDEEKAAEAAEVERELKELEELEKEKMQAQMAATSVAEVMEMIKEDPRKFADELGVELSDADLKNMKIDPEADSESPKKPSKAKKVELPRKKVSPDELAARKASADAARRASDPTKRLRSAYKQNKTD